MGTTEFHKLGLNGKPQPQVLDAFLEMYQISQNKERIIYIGDSKADEKFAENCGVAFQEFDPKCNELNETKPYLGYKAQIAKFTMK